MAVPVLHIIELRLPPIVLCLSSAGVHVDLMARGWQNDPIQILLPEYSGICVKSSLL